MDVLKIIDARKATQALGKNGTMTLYFRDNIDGYVLMVIYFFKKLEYLLTIQSNDSHQIVQ